MKRGECSRDHHLRRALVLNCFDCRGLSNWRSDIGILKHLSGQRSNRLEPIDQFSFLENRFVRPE